MLKLNPELERDLAAIVRNGPMESLGGRKSRPDAPGGFAGTREPLRGQAPARQIQPPTRTALSAAAGRAAGCIFARTAQDRGPAG